MPRKMERHILHLDLDSFYVSVERLKDSSLMGKPVVVGGTSERGVVASCSYEARAMGVKSAMSSKMAKRLCPDAIFIKGDYAAYNKYSAMVSDILYEQAPIVEKASIDEHYCDVTGLDKYFGCYKWASSLRQKIMKETGLPISFGLASSKTIAKIATGQAKPNGQLYVPAGTEVQFLAPLPVRKIPMIGEKTTQKLQQLGIQYIWQIQQMTQQELVKQFGENGLFIWRKANGICNSEVMPHGERKSISKEETFGRDTNDVQLIKKIIMRMVDGIAFDLRKHKWLTSCVTVKIRYSDFQTETCQGRVDYTSWDETIADKALELFNKHYKPNRPIRLIGVRLSDLIHGNCQIDMFNNTVGQVDLCAAIDGIRERFGTKIVSRASII